MPLQKNYAPILTTVSAYGTLAVIQKTISTVTTGYQDISKTDCIRISNKIRDDIYQPAYNCKTTVFLGGTDSTHKNKIRHEIAAALESRFWTNIIHPEDLSDELLYFERLLADSVDAIVLIPESPGSFAELEAYAKDEKLRSKLICIIDKKYKKDKSSINQELLKLVKKGNRFGLLYIDPNQIDRGIGKLISALKKMKKSGAKHDAKISLLQLEHFLLPSIYLLEPVSKETLINLVASAAEDEADSFQTTTAALTMLIKKKQIQWSANGYKLTTLGLDTFFAFQKTKTRTKRQDEIIEIDNLRLEILNLKNRNKKLEA